MYVFGNMRVVCIWLMPRTDLFMWKNSINVTTEGWEANKMGWEKSWICIQNLTIHCTPHTAQQTHTQIPPSTHIYIYELWNEKKKNRWRTCSHNKQRQLRAKMYTHVEVLNSNGWKLHRKKPSKVFYISHCEMKKFFFK